jgi:hypothetical protein
MTIRLIYDERDKNHIFTTILFEYADINLCTNKSE